MPKRPVELYLGEEREVVITGVNPTHYPAFTNELLIEQPSVNQLIGPLGYVASLNGMVHNVRMPGLEYSGDNGRGVSWETWVGKTKEFFDCIHNLIEGLVETPMHTHRIAVARSGPVIEGLKPRQNGLESDYFVIPNMRALMSMAYPASRSAALANPDSDRFLKARLAFVERDPKNQVGYARPQPRPQRRYQGRPRGPYVRRPKTGHF